MAADHDLADLLGLGELALGAHHVAPLALVDVAGGHRDVGGAQGVDHVGDGQAVARHALRIDDHLQLALAAAIDVDIGHAADPFQPVLDGVLDEVPIGVDRPVVAFFPGQDEPGDRAVLGGRRGQGRLVGLVRVAVDAVQPVRDQQQRAIHVLADLELERDLGRTVAGAREHPLDALQATQHVFLLVEDLALDLDRCCARPLGRDHDDRLAHVGGELNRDRGQRHRAEHQRHQDCCDDRDRPFDRQPDQVHVSSRSSCCLSQDPARRDR